VNISRILFPVKVLGIGNRVGIWFSGCSRKCPGCSNPELWEPDQKSEISLSKLKLLINKLASKHKIDGFTITGGEPFEQAKDLLELVSFLNSLTQDILLYTGYSLQNLLKNSSDVISEILASIAVLIDGEYIEEFNNDSPLRGSCNQNIYIFNTYLHDSYIRYFKSASNVIQNFTTTNGIVSVGIHRKNFTYDIERILFNQAERSVHV